MKLHDLVVRVMVNEQIPHIGFYSLGWIFLYTGGPPLVLNSEERAINCFTSVSRN
jgi:hypothetical protein